MVSTIADNRVFTSPLPLHVSDEPIRNHVLGLDSLLLTELLGLFKDEPEILEVLDEHRDELLIERRHGGDCDLVFAVLC